MVALQVLDEGSERVSLALDGLPSLTGWPLQLATVGIVAAALGKAAQLPFSFWLARAMQAPSAVSALATPPDAPCTSIVCPGRRPDFTNSIR